VSAPSYEPSAATAAQLREVRYALGLTLDDVAALTGLHRDTIYRLEHGHASDRARRIVAAALGVPHAEVWSEDEVRP